MFSKGGMNMQNIIAPMPNPFFKGVEQLILKTKIEKIIKNPRLSDEEKVKKIMTLVKVDYFLKNIIVY